MQQSRIFPFYNLDDAAVTAQKVSIAKDFTRRNYMAKASYTMLAAGSLWFAYKWGLFDSLLGKKESALPTLPVLPEATPVLPANVDALNHDQLLPMVKVLAERAKDQHDVNKILVEYAQDQSKKIASLETKHLEGKAHWFIEGVKYVGLTGFSMIAGIVVQSKWQKFYNYALAEPTFDWFYGSHSMLNRIDSLRYHVAGAIDTTGADSPGKP